MEITLDIVIVNWNSGVLLQECLDSVAHTMKKTYKLNGVIVVDNASSDNSITELICPDISLSIIKNESNLGFAAACNQGACDSTADYILFLNPDARLFQDSLEGPVNFMEQSSSKEIAICGIKLINDHGEITRTCTRFPSANDFLIKAIGLSKFAPNKFPDFVMSEWDHSDNREVCHVIGAFYLVRNSVFKILHGFDERYFVYLEDLDFSLRASMNGGHTYYLADFKAYHKEGGTSQQVKAKRLFYSLSSRIIYSYKNFSWLGVMLVLFVTFFIEPITRMMFALLRGTVIELKEIIQTYYMLIADLPSIVKRILN